MKVREISTDDDLHTLVKEINTASWDDANEMAEYDFGSLRSYIDLPGTLFVACYTQSQEADVLLGIASSRIETKPYGKKRWLYIDEVDVCVDFRNRGVGAAIMQALLEIAKREKCEEVWLATEVDNVPANALYRSIDPDEVAEVVGYTFSIRK